MGRFFFSRGAPRDGVRNFDPTCPEDVITLREFVGSLAPDDRRIAELIMSGHTQAEIGRALGVSQQAIAKRLKKLSRNLVVRRSLCVGMQVEEHNDA